MIGVSVLYRNKLGAHFDHAYYRDTHIPLILARLGAAVKSCVIYRCISANDTDAEPPYVAMVHLYSESLEVFQASFTAHAAELEADVLRYTNISPIIQVSEVVTPTEAASI
jgi:uncharacterized protein (TIGR02118 family)